MTQSADKDHKNSAPRGIWQSKLGWLITLAVFVTILVVQTGFSAVTLHMFKEDRKAEMRDFALSSVIPMLDVTRQPVLDAVAARKILTRTKITGLSIYSADGQEQLAQYGRSIPMSVEEINRRQRDMFSANSQFYNVLFYPDALGVPNVMAIQVESRHFVADVNEFIILRVLIAVLLSLLVTQVLMMALGHWLLEPLWLLRYKLLNAAKDPEHIPEDIEFASQEDGTRRKSEIAAVIESADHLIIQNAKNIRQLKETTESQIHKLAFYDSLTDVPNRTYFVEQLQKRAEREEDRHFAVIAVDLDHFRDINDTVGHHVGDIILKSVAKRLQSTIPEDALLARSGEDEFAIMVPFDTGEEDNIGQLADQIARAIRSKPFRALDEEFQIRSSIGIASFPDDAEDADQVLKCADIALNRAKEEGRDAIRVYSRAFDEVVQQRFTLLKDLRKAMQDEELQLHFQPQFSLKDGAVIGAEALLRWWKKGETGVGGQFIPPFEFISVAEQSGLILPIGDWVLQEACRRCVEWRMAGHEGVRVAVNVSAVQFQQDNFVERVSEILKDTGLPADRLELEVTESVFMEDIDNMITVLRGLNDLGVELAIDDFGTGYSSLSYLRRLPLDRLKIDRSFIVDASENEDGSSIARTIIALGQSLNLETIAEGVETKEQQDFLVRHGCELVQGFRYAKPMPMTQLLEFLKKHPDDLSLFDLNETNA